MATQMDNDRLRGQNLFTTGIVATICVDFVMLGGGTGTSQD